MFHGTFEWEASDTNRNLAGETIENSNK